MKSPIKAAWCHLCQTWTETPDMHHVAMRTPGNMNATIPLCRKCHSWVHENPAKATALGLLDKHQRFAREREYHTQNQ